MEEKEELTVEEMKDLISVAKVLPEILNEIEQIKISFSLFKQSLTEKFTENSKIVEEYIKQVNQYSEKVDKFLLASEEIKKSFDKKMAETLKLNIKDQAPIVKQPVIQPKKEETKKKEKDPEKEKIKEYGLKLLEEKKGRSFRMLTLINVKQAFHIDDETAQKVLDYLKARGVYNPYSKRLTFK